MKVHFQRLTSLLLALVLGLGLCVLSASAAEEQPVTSSGTFWQSVAANAPDFVGDFIGNIPVVGKLAGVCSVSEDRLHHGKVIGVDDAPLARPGSWVAKCDYCSQTFTVYDDDMQSAYNSHLDQMQKDYGATSINASGQFIMYIDGWTYAAPSGHTVLSTKTEYPFYQFMKTESGYQTVEMVSSDINLPISGTYLFCFPSLNEFDFADDSETGLYLYLHNVASNSDSSVVSFGYRAMREAGPNGYLTSSASLVGDSASFSYHVSLSFRSTDYYSHSVPQTWYTHARPYLAFESALVGDISIDSRVGNLSGDYGIIGDNGTIIKSDTQYIVNETTNTYTNPATGQTSPITDWTYDYSDRSYNLTLEGGSTTTVTYGDEQVIIKEGDTTYNVYYIVQGGGSGGETPPPTTPPTTSPTEHVHKYTSTVTTEPTCVGTGLKTYTCSECGDTYTEKIPAMGHSWAVDRTINTTYDEDGNVLTQGYTIYRCSVCGNEYKDEIGSGPPDDGKGDGDGQGFLGWLGEKLGELLGAIGDGVLSLIQAALGKILDGLIALVNMISEKLATVVEVFFDCLDVLPGIFSGFTDFLTAGFAFLPPEVITVITFGILMMVLVAVVKLFLK